MFANSAEPDQMPRLAASDLVLHCLRCPTKRTLGLYGLSIASCLWDIGSKPRPFGLEAKPLHIHSVAQW